MSTDTLASGKDRLAPGIVEASRSTARVLAAMVRDPLSSLPPESFSERMVLTRDFGQRRAYLSDPVLIHEALVRNADGLAKTPVTKQVLAPVLGEGLLTADGASWRWQRQALAPAFQHDRLTALLPAMIAAAEATRDRWLALPAGGVLDIGHEMMRTTFEIILETMLSGPGGLQAGRFERSLTDTLRVTSLKLALALLRAPPWLPFPGKRRAETAVRFMRDAVEGIVAARRRTGGAQDLVGMLLAARDPATGAAMSDQEIADNILTFILAGHETTAIALGWTFALLADRSDIVARLRAEVDAVTGGAPLAPGHVASLGYTRQVISEAMRLYPPAPLIARVVERQVEIAGVPMAAGSILFVPIYAVHRHIALWRQPDTFDPERFAPDAVRARHRFAYMPFGAGPRVCIGNAFALMEAAAILAVLVRPVSLARLDPDLPAPLMQLTLRPKTPIRMRIAAR